MSGGIQYLPILAAGDAVPPLFALLAVMLVAVVLVSLLLLRVQRSLLVGYFCCGILIANTGVIEWLGGGESREAVRQMADFGVMLLMFVIGLEFSVSELRYLRRFALAGGGIQMAVCLVVAMAVARLAGLSWPASIVLSVALAMSSTAISLKTFQDMGLSTSPGARFALGVAIFQDLFIIAFLVFLPFVMGGGDGGSWAGQVGLLMARGTAFVALAAVSAKWIIPAVLHSVARTRHRELFTVAVMGCCLGLAFAAALMHLSLALGAFVAGLAVSESVFKHRILADILPIKDVFLTLFFVSVGLLIDLRLALENWSLILGITLLLITGKTVVITGIAWWLGLINRPALLGALSLCSAGEFSLLLLQNAGATGMWSPALQQALVAGSTLSMGLVPALMRLADPAAAWLNAHRQGRLHPVHAAGDQASVRQRLKQMTGHAIICGHGPVGRDLNRALVDAGISTLVLEMNVDTVRQLLRQGQPVLFADAAHEETWTLARLEVASLVAFTFPDAAASAAALHHVRERHPEVCVLARVRFASDQARLERLGVSVVIQDEEEAARAIIDSALRITAKSAGNRDDVDT